MASKPKDKSKLAALVKRLEAEAACGDTQIEQRAKDLLLIIESI